MKKFSRIIFSVATTLLLVQTAYSQHVVKNASLGIGTTNPAQKVEVAGINNTVRIDGLTGATFKINPSSIVSFLYVNNNGDFYAMPTVANTILYNGTGVPAWASSASIFNAWSISSGNTISTTYGTNKLGTINTTGNQPLEFKANNAFAGVIDPTYSNVYFGGVSGTGAGNESGSTLVTNASNNVAIGVSALGTAATATSYRTAVGYFALHNDKATITAMANTAVGYQSGYFVSTNIPITAFGYRAIGYTSSAITGSYLTAFGNTTIGAAQVSGTKSVALGTMALQALTSGNGNTAVGYQSLSATTSGSFNTAVGYLAVHGNSVNNGNTAVGWEAGYQATTTTYGRNVSIGYSTINAGSTNGENVAVGTNAAHTISSIFAGAATTKPDVAIGDSAMYNANTGGQAVAVGYGALRAWSSSSSTATYDVALGFAAMIGYNFINITPTYTTAVGSQAYFKTNASTTLASTTIIGAGAFGAPGAANNQIAVGAGAMGSTSETIAGGFNIAIGSTNNVIYNPAVTSALLPGAPLGSLTSGANNLAIGYNAGYGTTSGASNVLIGINSGSALTTGGSNTLIGDNTLVSPVGSTNVAIGDSANTSYGSLATSNVNNIAVGANAAAGISPISTSNDYYNVAVGYNSVASPVSPSSTQLSAATAIGAYAQALAGNAIAIGANAFTNTSNTLILGSVAGVNGATSNVSVGIGTNAPAQALEIAGLPNTIRVGGLVSTPSAGSFYSSTPGTASNVVYTNKSTGDLYSLPNGTTGQQLVLSSTGVPIWGSASFSLSATLPLSNTSGTGVPNILLSGTIGGVLFGEGGTGSAFDTAGAVGYVLTSTGTGSDMAWTSLSSLPGGTNDNWGAQVIETDSTTSTASSKNTITGIGTSASPLRLAKQLAANNNILAWNGITWKPATVTASLVKKNIIGGTAIKITNGTNQVVGSSNVTVDVQGTAGGVLTGAALASAVFSAAGTAGYYLTSTGATAPTWQLFPILWSITGNSTVVPGTNFLGTLDNKQLRFFLGGLTTSTNGQAGSIDPLVVGATTFANTYLGAAYTTTTNGAGGNDQGSYNVGFGMGAMGYAGGASTNNVAIGSRAMLGTSSGNMTSKYNVAVGSQSMTNAINGASYETGIGANTLGGISNATIPLYNTAIGYFSMYGQAANGLYFGSGNTALGYKSLYTPTAGGGASNTAQGANAAYQSTGSGNTAVGDSTLYTNTTGSNNTAVGYHADNLTASLSNATSVGALAASNQSNSLTLGQINGVNGATSGTHVSIGTTTPATDAALAIKKNHLEAQGSLGLGNVFVGVPAAGNGAAAYINNNANDVAGSISLNTGSGPIAGQEVSVLFGIPYTNPPIVSLSPANAAAADAMANGGVYVTVNTTTFTINFASAPSGSTNYLFNYFIIETPGTPPSVVPCSLPITLTNNQSSATLTGFQQLLTVNSSLYSTMESTGLQNIEFTVGNTAALGGTPLQTWIESGASSSSTSTIYWINLGSNIIPAQVSGTPGTLTIYMNFMPNSVMSATGPTGEAPQLSGTYAQYDNGGLVFPNVYTRWGGNSGTTLPTTAVTGAINGGAISAHGTLGANINITDNATNTVLTYLNNSGAAEGLAYTTTPSSVTTFPNVLESYVAMTGNFMVFGTGSGIGETGAGVTIDYDYPGFSASNFGLKSNGGGPSFTFNGSTGFSTGPLTTNPVVWSVLLGSSTSITSVYQNYTQVAGTYSGQTLSPPTYFGYFGTSQNGGTNTETIYWTRTRLYPPTGIMPTAAYGTSVCAGSGQPTNPNPCSVPVTITNTQSTPTVSNFAQMITVNSSSYTSEELSGLQNVEFSTGPQGTGTVLQSWLESGNSNTSTNTIYWVNLGSNIVPAGGSITIYMDFMSSNILSATGPAGEAPQLSGTGVNYGLYDNGANIFEYYANFKGTGSLPSGLSITAGTATMNNGLTIPSAGQNVNIVSGSTGYDFTQNILETYGYDGTALNSNANDRYLVWNDAPSGATNAIYIAGSYYIYGTCAGPAPIIISGVTGSNIWSLWQHSGNAIGTYNYTTSTSASSSCSTSSPYYISLGTAGGGSFYQYVRIRTAPPGGSMPVAALGTITCCPIPPPLGSITGSATFCPYQTGVTYSVVASTDPTVTGYQWTLPTGATITAGANTTNITVSFGAVGGTVSVATLNSCGSVGTASTLTVTPQFSITGQPTSASASCLTGSSATFSVTTSGSVAGYQWQVSTDNGVTWTNITSSGGGVYSGYTTQNLVVTSPPYSMNGYKYQCVVTGSTCPTPVISNVVTLTVMGSIPITITNSNLTTATPANFQQMITVNSATYASQEMSGLQNVEFSTAPSGTGTLLQAWIESGATSSSTSTVYWVNLGSDIVPANSSITIYMTFTGSSVLSATGPTGEAPQLSGLTTGTYGAYDNGALVFTFYDNFISSSSTLFSSNWSSPEVLGSCTQTVSNGITFNSGTGSGASGSNVYVDAISSVNTFAPPIVAELYMTSTTSSVGSVRSLMPGLTDYSVTAAPNPGDIGDTYYSNSSPQANNPNPYMCWSDAQNGGYTTSTWAQQGNTTNTTNPYSEYGTNVATPSTYNIWGLYYNATSAGNSWWENYTNKYTSSNGTTYSPTGSVYFSLGIDNAGSGAAATISSYWARVRQYPPGATMPTAVLGTESCCASPAALTGGITGATTFCPGTTSTYSAASGASSYLWTVPSGSTFTGSGNSISVTFGSTAGNITVAPVSSCGTVGSALTLPVTPAYSVTGPANQSVSCSASSTTNFTVTTTGSIASYQWQVSTNGGTSWTSLGTGTSPYSGTQTATLIITGADVSMNGYQYRCVVTGSCGGSLNSSAGTLNVFGNIPITLTNTQSAATSANFQQIITVNSSNYSTQEMSGLQNVEFTVGGPAGASGATQLSSWLESGNTNTSTSTIYWINLGSHVIPAQVSGVPGTLVIYMNFMSTSVLSAGPAPCAGEAPQLSGTYGQYDNGGVVFPNVYTRWGGLTGGVVPTTVNGDAVTGGNISVINSSGVGITNNTANTQLTFSGGNNSTSYGVAYATTPTSVTTFPNVLESYVAMTGYYMWYGTGSGNEENGTGVVLCEDYPGFSSTVFGIKSNNQAAQDYTTAPLTSSPEVWSMLELNSSTVESILENYTQVLGVVTSSISLSSPTYYGYFGTAQNGGSNQETVYWTRTRIYPPNGVMPSASLSGTLCCSVPSAPGSITSSLGTSPASFCAGNTATFTIPSVSNATYVWTVPTGSTITGGPGTNSITVLLGNSSGTVTVSTQNSCGESGGTSSFTLNNLLTITGPSSSTVSCGGGNATFTVTVSGSPTYQWQVSTDGGVTWTSLGTGTSPYSGTQTATLTITAPPSTMNGYEYRCQVTSASCASGATSAVSTLNVGSGYSVQIQLNNLQGVATSANFQEKLNINFSIYGSASPALDPNLDNVEFTTGPAGTGTQLYAWIENGGTTTPATAASSSSSNAIVWVNLGSTTIGPSSSINIYMNFMPSPVMGVPTGATAYTGEAPDITTTYAQYDNGGKVFPNVYTRWGGLSGGTLPTTVNGDAVNGGGISLYNSASYGTASVTNSTNYTQLNITGSLFSFDYGYPDDIHGIYYTTTPSSSYSFPTVLESEVNIGDTYSWFGTGNGEEEEGWGATICNDNNNGSNPDYSVRSNNNLQSSTYCGSGSYSFGDYSTLSETTPTTEVWSILLNYTGGKDYITSAMYNYTTIPGITFPLQIDPSLASAYQNTSSCSSTLGGTLFGYFGTYQNTPNSTPYEQIYWTRTRLFPPNGIMPSVTVNAYNCY